MYLWVQAIYPLTDEVTLTGGNTRTCTYTNDHTLAPSPCKGLTQLRLGLSSNLTT